MVNLLKTFGKGILYVIGSPFFIAALLLFGVIGLVAFVFQLFKSIFFFFTGQKFFPELPEDKELRLMKENETTNRNSPFVDEPMDFVPEEQPAITPNEPIPSIEEPVKEQPYDQEIHDAFFVDEKESLPAEEEEEPQNDVIEEHHVVDTENKIDLPKEKIEEEEEEIIETYVPNRSSFDNDDDEDTSDTGVKIDYDL